MSVLQTLGFVKVEPVAAPTTVDSVMSAFNKAIDDLEQVASHNADVVINERRRAEEALAAAEAADAELERALTVKQKLVALMSA